MTEPRDDARGELLALAENYLANNAAESGADVLIKELAAALRAAPARCDAESVELIYNSLTQAQDCIRGETPEDITDEQAREDTINKVRDAMRAVEALVPPPSEAGREALEAFQRIQGYADNPGLVYTICSKMIDRLSPDPGTVAVASGDPVSQMSHELTRANAVNKALRDARLLLEANGYTVASTMRGGDA